MLGPVVHTKEIDDNQYIHYLALICFEPGKVLDIEDHYTSQIIACEITDDNIVNIEQATQKLFSLANSMNYYGE